MYCKNEISITMCDVEGARGGGGSIRKDVHMTFLIDKIDTRGFPNVDGNFL